MSLSIPRRYPGRFGPRGERKVRCDYCSMMWLRSACRRDAAGLLACPDDQAGRDVVTLDRANAAGALSTRPVKPPPERW